MTPEQRWSRASQGAYWALLQTWRGRRKRHAPSLRQTFWITDQEYTQTIRDACGPRGIKGGEVYSILSGIELLTPERHQIPANSPNLAFAGHVIYWLDDLIAAAYLRWEEARGR